MHQRMIAFSGKVAMPVNPCRRTRGKFNCHRRMLFYFKTTLLVLPLILFKVCSSVPLFLSSSRKILQDPLRLEILSQWLFLLNKLMVMRIFQWLSLEIRGSRILPMLDVAGLGFSGLNYRPCSLPSILEPHCKLSRAQVDSYNELVLILSRYCQRKAVYICDPTMR